MAFWTPTTRQALLAALRTRWPLGARAGLAVGLPLLIGAIAGRPSWGALASMGGFAAFYARAAPFRHRSRTVAWVGLALAIAVPVSGLVAGTAWLTILWIAVASGLASFVCLALEVPPPREYLIVLAVLAGTGIPVNGAGAVRELWLVAAGALIAWLLGAAAELARRSPEPTSAALDRAWAATVGVLAATGTPGSASARAAAVAAVRQGRVVLAQAGPEMIERLGPVEAAVEIVLAAALSISIDSDVPLAPAVISALRAGGPGRMVTPSASPAALRRALEIARGVIAGDDPDGPELESIARSARPLPRLEEALRARGVVLYAAVRIAVTVAAGAGIGRVIGLDHSYWVGLTAAAALQANNVTMLLGRSLHRVAGTVAGVALAGGLLSISRAGACVAIIAGLAQAVAEMFIAASYAVGVTFVTVVALSIYELATPAGDIHTVIPARLLDTAIGAALVVVLRSVLWPRVSAARLPRAQAEVLRTTAELFRLRWLEPGGRFAPARHRLQEDLIDLRTLAADARADQPFLRGGGSDRSDPVTAAVESLATLALGVPFGRAAPDGPAARAYVAEWLALAELLDGGDPFPVETRPPELAGYPRTSAATRMLTLALYGERNGQVRLGARRPRARGR